jgi:hypothetical protein
MLAALAALSVAACAPEAPPQAAAPVNVQSGVGTTAQDVLVTQRGGSSAAVQNPVATGRSEAGIVRSGTGRGTMASGRNVQMRPDGTGGQSVDRGPDVGAPAPGQPRR